MPGRKYLRKLVGTAVVESSGFEGVQPTVSASAWEKADGEGDGGRRA